MIEPAANLARQASTCRVLPASEDFTSLYINLTGLLNVDRFSAVGTLLDAGHPDAAWKLLRPRVPAERDAALLGGIAALQAGDTTGAIEALEPVVAAGVIEPPVDGAIVFAFSDEAMLAFEVDGVGALALLVFAYESDGRGDDAVWLAAEAFRVTGAHAFLVFQLWLLRDAERWDDLLLAAENADPEDRARFEIDLQCARALEASQRRTEAIELYRRVGDIDSDLTWIQAARSRLTELGDVGDELQALSEYNDDQGAPDFDGESLELNEEAEAPWRYDPLAPVYHARIRPGGPMPTGPPPTNTPTSPMVGASLSLGPFSDGLVLVRALRSLYGEPPATAWLEALDTEAPSDVLSRLDDAIRAEAPLVGFRKRPDPAAVQAKVWQRALGALLSAAAERPEAPERLAAVLTDPECREYVEQPGLFVDAMIRSTIGECSVATAGGMESFLLPLVSRLHLRGEIDAAKAWVDWAASGSTSGALRCAETALAFRTEDDDRVLRLTDALNASDERSLVLLTYRARSLQRSNRPEPALHILGDVVKAARRMGDDAMTLTEAQYLQARACMLVGRHAQALDYLNAIEAVESDFLDVRDRLEQLARPQATVRGHIPRETRYAVWEQYEGRCADCDSSFDLQYDHIIPVAMGGSSNVENLQLLCGRCNRGKAARLG